MSATLPAPASVFNPSPADLLELDAWYASTELPVTDADLDELYAGLPESERAEIEARDRAEAICDCLGADGIPAAVEAYLDAEEFSGRAA